CVAVLFCHSVRVCLTALHSAISLSFSIPRPPPRSTLFPYTTLFRSDECLGHFARFFVGAGDDRRIGDGRVAEQDGFELGRRHLQDRKSTRLNSSHGSISYAVFCLKKKKSRGRSSAREPRSSTWPPIYCTKWTGATGATWSTRRRAKDIDTPHTAGSGRSDRAAARD